MILGLDIGGTYIKAGLISKGNLIEKITIKTGKNKKEIISNILAVINCFNLNKVKGIGIGVPGPADYKKGIVKHTGNLDLNGVNIKKIVSDKFNKKVIMENDANCFVLGESLRLKKKNIVGLTLGTGVGGGIVIDGKLYTGQGNAGELGHIIIDGGKDIEDYVSAKSIMKRYGKEPPKLSKKEFDEVGKIIGIGISNIVDSFDPEVVVIGGGISNNFSKFKSSMMKEIKKRALRKVKVVKGSLDSGIIGASSLVS